MLVLFLGRNNGLEGNSNSVMEICSFVKMSVQDGKNGLEPAFYEDVYDIIYIYMDVNGLWMTRNQNLLVLRKKD